MASLARVLGPNARNIVVLDEASKIVHKILSEVDNHEDLEEQIARLNKYDRSPSSAEDLRRLVKFSPNKIFLYFYFKQECIDIFGRPYKFKGLSYGSNSGLGFWFGSFPFINKVYSQLYIVDDARFSRKAWREALLFSNGLMEEFDDPGRGTNQIGVGWWEGIEHAKINIKPSKLRKSELAYAHDALRYFYLDESEYCQWRYGRFHSKIRDLVSSSR